MDQSGRAWRILMDATSIQALVILLLVMQLIIKS